MLSQSQRLFSSTKRGRKNKTHNLAHSITNECTPILCVLDKIRDICINPAWRLLITTTSDDIIRPEGVDAIKNILYALTDTSVFLNEHLIKDIFETVRMICKRQAKKPSCFRDPITQAFYEILSNVPSIYDGHVHYKSLEVELDLINKQLNATLIPFKQVFHPGP